MLNFKNRRSGLGSVWMVSAVAGLVVLASVPRVLAVSSITYNFDQTLFGTPPSGPVPWLTAVFTDVAPGTVNVTLAAPGLTGSEAVNQLYFNLNPALNASALNFSQTGANGVFGFPTVGVGTDAFKAPYDGKYDIMFSFSSAVGSQFVRGDSVTFSITGIAGLTANDFVYQNTASSGHSTLFAAADIQTLGQAVITDTPPDTGGRPVPDGGATVALLGLGVLALEVTRRGLRFARR